MVQWKSSGIHQTKRHTPLSPTLLTNSNSYYPVEPSANGQLVKVEIPKPFGERFLKNDSAEMRLSSRRYGNCVDRAGPLPFNLHESWTSLNPLDLKFVFRYEQSSVPDESAASPARDSDEQPLKVLALIDVTITAVAKVKTVIRMRKVQMTEVVSIRWCQQGLEEKECSPVNKRFSSVQVRIHDKKGISQCFYYIMNISSQQVLKMGF